MHIIFCLLIMCTTTNPISISICDCSKPVTRGLLDLNDPEYCFKQGEKRDEHKRISSPPIFYRIITKQDHDRKIDALLCSKWVETKKITGTFWLGAFDTEYFHTTKEVSKQECWDMKLKFACETNKNVLNGKTYSFIQKPVGEGYFWRIKEYSVTNCIAQEIVLRQETEDGPSISIWCTQRIIT